jgi:hypothetical protein
MLAKDDLRGFLRFLDQASIKELVKRQGDYVRLLRSLTDEEVIRDTRFLLRLLEEELVVRLDLEALRSRRR